MKLLPTASRNRRLLFGSVFLMAALGQAWIPQPVVTALLQPIEVLFSPLTQAAGWLQQGLQPTEEQRPPQLSPSLGRELGSLERMLGRPREVGGIVWLETPVLSVDPKRHQIEILAAPGLALALGMPVAFGSQYLGRLESVADGVGVVRTWQGADVRTGLAWETEEGGLVHGVSLGRGAGGEAVVQWMEEEQDLRENALVWWRPRPDEAPQLREAGLQLGHLARRGDAARGNQLWLLEAKVPAGAEGRVFLAAGAVTETLVAEAPVRESSATLWLRGDAVFGPGWACFEAAQGNSYRVLTGGEMVLGRVRQERGNRLWVRRESLPAWQDAAVLVQEDRLLSRDQAAVDAAQGRWCTRGQDGVPRGLWLGEMDTPAQSWPAPYRLWAKGKVEVGE